jgi:hypothetical protein
MHISNLIKSLKNIKILDELNCLLGHKEHRTVCHGRARGDAVVKELRYKPEGRRIDSR